MQLIGMLDSPYVRRVAIALIVAKVPFTHRPTSLFRHIDEFSSINPLLEAPTLLTDDRAAQIDSNVILDYLAGVDTRRPAHGAPSLRIKRRGAATASLRSIVLSGAPWRRPAATRAA